MAEEQTSEELRSVINDEAAEVEPADSIDEVETDAGSDEEGSEEQELILGKYESVDQVAEALRQAETELYNARRELNTTSTEKKEPETSLSREEQLKAWARELQDDPLAAVERLIDKKVSRVESQTKSAQFNQHYQAMAANEEFKQLEPTMAAIAQQYKPLIEQAGIANDPLVLDMLYYAAKGLTQNNAVKDAEKQGQRKGERTAVRKQRAKVEGGSASKGKTSHKFDSLSLEDMRREISAGNLG